MMKPSTCKREMGDNMVLSERGKREIIMGLDLIRTRFNDTGLISSLFDLFPVFKILIQN